MAVPHAPQKRAEAGTGLPQVEHCMAREHIKTSLLRLAWDT